MYDAFVASAVAAYEEGDWERALTYFRRAHAAIPNPRALRGIGMCEVQLARWADAYRTLRAALEMQADAERALSSDLRAHVTLLMTEARSHVAVWHVPEGVSVELDGAPAVLLDDGTLVVAAGSHTVHVRDAHGHEAHATIEVSAGAQGDVPVVVPEPTPEPLPPPPPPRAPLVQQRDERIVPRASSVEVRADPGLGAVLPRPLTTRFVIWAQGVLGGWIAQEQERFAPAAGFGLTLGFLVRVMDELSIGATFEGTWGENLDTCPEGPTYTACNWFQPAARLTFDMRLDDVPLSIVAAVGIGFPFRIAPGSLAAAAAVVLDAGVRWLFADDALFLGLDLRSSISSWGNFTPALVFGAQTR